jgi:hypothetical protein
VRAEPAFAALDMRIPRASLDAWMSPAFLIRGPYLSYAMLLLTPKQVCERVIRGVEML